MSVSQCRPFAALASQAAAVDSLALTRSALVGRAELLRTRTLRALGDSAAARATVMRAVLALENGLGPANGYTLAARSLRDTLSH